MDEEKKRCKNPERYTQLLTMIPIEVYLELTEMAKSRETFTGSWDYGNTLRELLYTYKQFVTLHTRMDKIELHMDNIEAEQFKASDEAKVPEKKEKKRVLLGKNEEEGLK